MLMRDHIILKYADRRVPRYTSYPTAPNFSAEITATDYKSWLTALNPAEPASLYLHVPYCRDMCWYCGCNTKATRQFGPVERFSEILLKEIDLVAAQLPARMKVSHIHWGGGSPTYVRPQRFIEIMDRLKSRFDVAAAAEIAIEIDPRHFSQALADAFKTSGITRASLGVQTFDEDVQAAVNRVQSADTVAQCVDLLRSAGVSGLNFDLIYGLPLQTVESCRMTAREALRFSPDRFSVFGYAHVPHFKAHQRMIRDDDLPDVSSRLNQACAIAGELTQAGYIPIGLDHFAKPDDSLALAHAQRKVRRNFQGYTTDDAAAIIGFGPSAVGWLPQGYVQNSPATPDWERRIEAGELPIARGRRLTVEDRFRGEIIERLMCDLEADIAAIAARHGFPQPESDFSAFIESGIVTADASLVRVNREYRPLVRNIAAVFDAYLLGSTAQYSLAV